MGERGEREEEIQISSYKISHGNVMYRTRNIVNSTVTTLYSDRWLLDLW